MCRIPPRSLRAAALIGALALTWGSGCGAGDGDASDGFTPKPPTVEVMTVTPEPLRELVDIPGQFTAELSVMVTPEIEGLLDTVHFEEGQPVERDAVLFRLRDAEQAARVREAEAEHVLASEVYERTRRLKERDVSSAAQLDEAAAERDVALARVNLARVALARTVIRAPFDGVMGDLMVSPGDHVKEDTELVRIDAIDRLQLRFSLPEIAVGIVRTGIPVKIRVAPYPERIFPGEVYFVSPTLDPAVRRILIKAWVPNPDHLLRPGLFAQIEAEIGQREAALVVPESALVPALDGTYVWRIGEGDVAERVSVGVGLRSEGRVEIVSGLSQGDRVVTAGVGKVTSGKAVEPVPARVARELPDAEAPPEPQDS